MLVDKIYDTRLKTLVNMKIPFNYLIFLFLFHIVPGIL